MSAWVLVPCLVALRSEFNAIAPNRDRGADGAIGDSAHTSASDHTPDEDSDILRDHDADSKNEVHALDIDSSGPWPGGWAWFDQTIKALVERERQEYLSPTAVGRLKYVIWNRRIASRSDGWIWRPYSGKDPHTNHAHFSARYESGPEADMRPWGVAQTGDDMSVQDVRDYFKSAATGVRGDGATSVNRADREDVTAVLRFALGINFADQDKVTTSNQLNTIANALASLPGSTAREVLQAFGNGTASPQAVADALKAVLRDQAVPVGKLLSGQA